VLMLMLLFSCIYSEKLFTATHNSAAGKSSAHRSINKTAAELNSRIKDFLSSNQIIWPGGVVGYHISLTSSLTIFREGPGIGAFT
jgi:hypothetical protein